MNNVPCLSLKTLTRKGMFMDLQVYSDDCVERNDYYPKNVHSNDKMIVDSQTPWGLYLVFFKSLNPKFKCHDCGLPIYIIYNLQKCSKTEGQKGVRQIIKRNEKRERYNSRKVSRRKKCICLPKFNKRIKKLKQNTTN